MKQRRKLILAAGLAIVTLIFAGAALATYYDIYGTNLHLKGDAQFQDATPLIFEGATNDAYETTFSVTDPTADRTITIPNATGTVSLSPGAEGAATAVWFAANAVVAEGATENAYETSISFTDPTADRTITIPDGSGAPMLSALTTNATDAANAVTGASNGLVYEGTANAHELTLSATDPTGDRTMTLPEMGANSAVMCSTLTTNTAGAANAVTGASNGLIFEGSSADDHETTISATNPTADRTVTLADAGGTVMLSSLATNGADAANAVTGASNGLVYEGSANDYELTLSATDPVSDVTLTLPQYTGDIPIVVGQDYAQHSQAGIGTADGSSWTIPANTMAVGTALRVTVAGTLAGGNTAPKVHLYIDNAQIVSLTFPAATAGDWCGEFVIGEHTDTANQKVFGRLDTAAGAGAVADYATDTTDTTSAFTVKLQVEGTHANDTIAQEMGLLEFLP